MSNPAAEFDDRPEDTAGTHGSAGTPVAPAPATPEDAEQAARAAAAAQQEKYDQMLALADLFDATGSELRARARLGEQILRDEDVEPSAPLSPRTYEAAETEIRAATTGKNGLLSRSIELDADALVVRATVLTYRWIDELQDVAYRTLGSIAGRAIGYLAPEVALGGAIVSAGLIETDSMDRDGLATYLGELAEQNPDLLHHVTSGGGGLLESLQMRSLLTASFLAGDRGTDAGRAGLEAVGAGDFANDAGAALRDVAVGLTGDAVTEPEPTGGADDEDAAAPRSIAELMSTLSSVQQRVRVQRVADGRYIAYLPGATRGGGRLRLVDGDTGRYGAQLVAALEEAVGDTTDARVMLVGAAHGGLTATEVAAAAPSSRFTVDQVVTAGAPSAQVPVVPETTRVLSLEDRTDPVALLGSLINQGVPNRVTVVFDGETARRSGATDMYVAGGRAADTSTHPALRAEIDRLVELGYLAAG
ncbi:hypothetical protein RDV89_10170 [Nocardioides zeae]|uniref:Uncharacterized protein n=1 Tax=Nocardioides imazamoxiresistens TaxID=3231893 RepID=A0ABU3PW27_9ACTN|nr:hypothetical protein [Nocardioides zeae]MDT9593433.1 hypothetical protein [Nocardioides zeae]